METHELVDLRCHRAAATGLVLALDQQTEHVDVVRRPRIRFPILDEAARGLTIACLDGDPANQIARRLDEARLWQREQAIEMTASTGPGAFLVREARALVEGLLAER